MITKHVVVDVAAKMKSTVRPGDTVVLGEKAEWNESLTDLDARSVGDWMKTEYFDPNKGRRSRAVTGMVNFPMATHCLRDYYDKEHPPGWCDTQEGGMFVRLVVLDTRHLDEGAWMECCGGANRIIYDEVLLRPDFASEEKEMLANLGEHPFEKKLFPNLERKYSTAVARWKPDAIESHISTGFLAVLTIGSTGQSLCKDGEYWRCTWADLNEDGKALHELLGKQYVGCEIILTTWLDT